MRISDWSSDVCSSDLDRNGIRPTRRSDSRGGGDVVGGGNRRYCRFLGGGAATGDEYRHRAAGPPLVRRPDGLRSGRGGDRSEEHTSELQSLMRISYAVFCLKKKMNTLLQHRQQLSLATYLHVYTP